MHVGAFFPRTDCHAPRPSEAKDGPGGIALIQDLQRVLELVQGGWSHLRVLVVGDVMLDKYIWGDVMRVSPEAPVPVVRAARQTESPGGAANVAMNLAHLGVHAIAAGIAGGDQDRTQLDQLLTQAGVEGHLVTTTDVPTTSKTRIIGGHQQMLRLDVETTNSVPQAVYDELIPVLGGLVKRVDAIVLSDYAKGVLTAPVCRQVIEEGRKRGIPVLVGPKGRNFERYAGALTICPNLHELSVAMGEPQNDTQGLFRLAQSRIAELGLEYLTVTMGEHGIAVLRQDSVVQIPACARQVFDVSGAGDTVIATLAAALASGLSIETAAELANLAAGVVVGKVGTAPIERHELLAELSSSMAVHAQEKILDRRQLAGLVAAWRAHGDTIVFTNGCFDLLHVGHIMLLEAARREGTRLVVAVNSDDSTRRLKGRNRPVIRQEERARILAALAAVDAVTVFEEDTPLGCILELRPDVIVKGSQYTASQVVGAREVRSWNGRVKIVPMVAGFSSTSLIARIAANGAS
jgi:D-beta-D-heptose 7-phosphate kinase/D-beta-D-heptose 1-phosphate adenosyltransferase